ncbi:LysR family transcriptional regulator [Flammeovirga kamogawensis]|uniref:LysR family transcriptional regulator n=1 Tax=Flammeovirga kamogawensis TaxID=373891 RepID=A0ABX8GQH0_9BACT|nr:LysR substrate-binding domain-containing protein [Flammeovirga kamogawensis]MBB6463066.1 DNA-binding transcriptional LysR family regulator [Flammeovirga kamogawensis]QWG05703.1 LysR family transcriptional regulator [Flammeovirga kamogawensis]TRX67531.1 LysR family transcriptional regulator [Flammeovirga kamogawensis]
MEIRHLKYFLAVAEELNFTKAANKLFISQPPLSRQIKELENELGAKLFERNNKKVVLTEAGKYFKEEVINQLQNLESVVLKTKKISENVNGEYRIGYISSTFSDKIAQLIKFLMGQYPFLKIKLYEVSTSKQIAALEQNKLDLGIIRAPLVSTKITSKLWFKDHYSFVYNSTLIGNVTDLSDVKDKVFVFFNKDYAPIYYNTLVEICSQYGFIPNIVHESNNINSIIQLVKNGLGVSIVPSSLKNSHTSPELSFLGLNNNFSTDVLIATPKNGETQITNSAVSFLLD